MFSCVFAGNRAEDDGGALFVASSLTRVANSLFHGNDVTEGPGGAIRKTSKSLELINCTIADNLALNGTGAGIESDGESLTIQNCILWGNEDEDGVEESSQIVANDGTFTITSTSVQEWTGNFGGGGRSSTVPGPG